MAHRWRIGAVPYLNALPLVVPLEREPPLPLEIRWGVPSELARWLETGEVDVAIVSSIAWLGHEGWGCVPNIAIACRGPVESVKVFSRVPPSEIDTLALDASSLTSAVLAQILLRERYGIAPQVKVCPPDLPAMLAQADAALLIGDPGLASNGLRTNGAIRWEMDLGEEWFRWTGLPFVFAVWAYRQDGFRSEWAAALQWAKERGLRTLPSWLPQEAQARHLPLGFCETYLLRALRYDLGEEEWEGLRLFRQLAQRHGFLPALEGREP